ncbi:Murein L,D-transpeptidase YcbB/YkuD [Chitinophaga eiseniae]|uniref:Murein L,D-transpeptidase YcbB/YkuD n=1 Tax=Chitinophaga eiseniae TaxID=634771 RepID=A0A1T4SLK1_9BACT|nr:L,D-transpeptidase family protein [Chitinophaga eiseniae]SKA29194.1 Murein L,D-transpeptidase YcbB/YkuD [Chitinophaga eiseniae]
MKPLLSILLLFYGLHTAAQPVRPAGPPVDAGVQLFYQKTGGRSVWTTATGRSHFDWLSACLQKAVYLGLDPHDYQPLLINALAENRLQMATAADTLRTDIRITETAIRFFMDVAFGRMTTPPVKYNELPPPQDIATNIAAKLADSLLAGNLSYFLQAIEPADTTYLQLKNSIAICYAAMADTAFREKAVTSLKADSSNTPLLVRLKQLGIRDSISGGNTKTLQEEIRKAQRLFNMLDDGVLRERFLKALNTPLSYRLQELHNGLNQARWLYYYKTQTAVVLVNIPSTTLFFYDHGKTVLYSRVITGKKSTPTPTLGSRLTEVILFPYWTVPHKIAVRELLPYIKRNRQYLADNQYEILDKSGRIVDPATISWSDLGAGNFPYVIRQNTGCDNSLGIVKLNFYSPFGVYLHDTPGKNLFMLQRRFFSHGCVRVEDAVQLGHLLVKEEAAAAMMALEAKGNQPDQKPVVFRIPATAYVFILYNTAWPDAFGQVKFYEDVYEKN